jgi:hypothetical protein
MGANVRFGDDVFLEDSTGVEGEETEKKELSVEQASEMALMRELIDSGGYRILHKVMVAELEAAQTATNDMRSSLDVIRFNQGIVAVVNRLRSLVINMTKEDFYVGKRFE